MNKQKSHSERLQDSVGHESNYVGNELERVIRSANAYNAHFHNIHKSRGFEKTDLLEDNPSEIEYTRNPGILNNMRDALFRKFDENIIVKPNDIEKIKIP